MDDLEQYVKEVKAQPGGRIEPLPEIKPYESFVYDARRRCARPFVPDTPVVAENGGAGGGVRPDTNRNREFLEQFPLDTLRMVGTLEAGGTFFGLVQDKDGLVHRVLPGNHLGQNDGKILRVTSVVDRAGGDRPRWAGRLLRAPGGCRAGQQVEHLETHMTSRPESFAAQRSRVRASARWSRRQRCTWPPTFAALGLTGPAGVLAAEAPSNYLDDIEVVALPGQQVQLRAQDARAGSDAAVLHDQQPGAHRHRPARHRASR